MVIGINCIEIDATYSGGINSFTYGLLDGFAKTGKEHSFNVFVNLQTRH